MMRVAILHEGNTKQTNDNGLIKLLLDSLNLNEDDAEFFGFGPKSNFYKVDYVKYSNLKLQIQEESISKVLFVIDADYEKNDKKCGGSEKTKSELEKIINELGLSEISDIYVTCDPQTNDGYLESLILSSIPKEQKECIETFLSHSNFNELKEKLQKLFKQEKENK